MFISRKISLLYYQKEFPFFFCTRFIYNHLFYTQNFSLTLIASAFSNWDEMAPYCRKRYHDSWYPPFWYLIDGRPNDSSCKSSWKSSILAIRRVKAIYSIVTGSRTQLVCRTALSCIYRVSKINILMEFYKKILIMRINIELIKVLFSFFNLY